MTKGRKRSWYKIELNDPDVIEAQQIYFQSSYRIDDSEALFAYKVDSYHVVVPFGICRQRIYNGPGVRYAMALRVKNREVRK